MSLVRSMVPPPVQVPAIAANGCRGAGLIAASTGSGSVLTCPSGILSCCAAAGKSASARKTAAVPQIMFDFMVTPLRIDDWRSALAECDLDAGDMNALGRDRHRLPDAVCGHRYPSGETAAACDRGDAIAGRAPADRTRDAVAGFAPAAENLAAALGHAAAQLELVAVAGGADVHGEALVAAADGVIGAAAQPFPG